MRLQPKRRASTDHRPGSPVLITKAVPTTSRIKMRPVPGQPPAKLEYKRRSWTAAFLSFDGNVHLFYS